MATVTGLTADRMLEIEAESIVGGVVDVGTGHLVLTRHDGGTIDAGLVVSSANLVDTIDDQSINGLKTFLELGTFEAGVDSKYISLGTDLDGTQSAIFADVPTAQSVQIVNLQKNGVTQYQIDQNAEVSAIGSDHYFGTNALDGTGERLHVQVDGSDVFLKAEASHADASLVLAPKGLGGVYFQKEDGTDWGWFGSDGALNLHQQSLHIRTNASANKRAQIFFESFSGVPEWSLLSDSLVNGTHDVGMYDNVNDQFGWRVDVTNAFLTYGSIKAIAADNYFGLNADGSSGSMVRLTGPTAEGVGVFAESSSADCSLTIQAKGNSAVYINPRNGLNNGLAISSDVNGKIYLVNNVSGDDGSSPGFVIQPRSGGSVQIWNGVSTLFSVNANAEMTVLGTNHNFGAAATYGGLHMDLNYGSGIALSATHPSSSNSDFAIRAKGAGSFLFQDPTGTYDLLQVASGGDLVSANNTGVELFRARSGDGAFVISGGSIIIPARTEAAVPTPASSQIALFMDPSGVLRMKLSDGTFRTFTFTNP